MRVRDLVAATPTGARLFGNATATPAERAQGLMFRESMPEDHGMLFDFETEQPVAFWMKNTPTPLDILFIRADGTVARIAVTFDRTSARYPM